MKPKLKVLNVSEKAHKAVKSGALKRGMKLGAFVERVIAFGLRALKEEEGK